jgi:mycofactocin precursor
MVAGSTCQTDGDAMTDPVVTNTEVEDTDAGETASSPVVEPLIAADLLVEDVSIDGMCGVY